MPLQYPSQRSIPIQDARLKFALRTAVGGEHGAVKLQPQWLESVYDTLQTKKSNLQIGIGAILPSSDPVVRSREVLKVVADVWIGCRPWVRTVAHGTL